MMTEEEIYLEEWCNLRLRRIQVLVIVGATILALKHPEYVGPAAETLRRLIRDLSTLVERYMPDDVLAEWERVLRPREEEGAG